MTALDALAAIERLLNDLQPACDVTDHEYGRPDQPCPDAAEWIERYVCGCDEDGRLLACASHHNLLPVLLRERICDHCGVEPVLVGMERL